MAHGPPDPFLQLALDTCRRYGYVFTDPPTKLGEGGQGGVYKASKDGQEYAIKVSKPKPEVPGHLRQTREYLDREIEIHWRLTRHPHPNLVGFVQACRISRDEAKAAGEISLEGWPVIVMEYIKPWDATKNLCTLQDLLHDRCVIGIPLLLIDVQNILRQVVRGILYMHGMGVVNRDIKPNNILVSKEEDSSAAFRMRVKLCDFGLTKHDVLHSAPNSYVGTRVYVAPEILQCAAVPENEYDGRKADVWSCGIVLYNLVALAFPYATNDLQENPVNESAWAATRMAQLSNAPEDLVRPGRIIDEEWNSCWELIEKMLQAKPLERITIEGVANHPFVVEPRETENWNADNANELWKGVDAEDAALGARLQP